MWLRRAFYGWLIPAAFLLPLWLLVGWGVFNAGGWAFLWVLFLAIPGVFLWQLLLTLLVRARGHRPRCIARSRGGTSLGFGVWHVLVISLGFFNPAWWAPVMVVAILVGVGPVLARAVAAVERGEADAHGAPHDRTASPTSRRWRREPAAAAAGGHRRHREAGPARRAEPFWPVAASMAEWMFVP